jgi:hypothetical protein
MKKLKRNPIKLDEQKRNPLKKKLVFIKKGKSKCEFHFPDGRKCGKYVQGKGNFCELHAKETFIEKRDNPITQNNTLFTKYDPINHPKLFIEFSSMGMNPHEIATQFNVSMGTLNEWRENNILFDQAWEIGRSALEAWYLRTGKDNLDNRWFQTNLFKFITMNNGLGWSDKAESRSQVQGQFGVLLVPSQMSMDEWEQNNIKKEQELQDRMNAEMIDICSDTDQNTIIEG